MQDIDQNVIRQLSWITSHGTIAQGNDIIINPNQ